MGCKSLQSQNLLQLELKPFNSTLRLLLILLYEAAQVLAVWIESVCEQQQLKSQHGLFCC